MKRAKHSNIAFRPFCLIEIIEKFVSLPAAQMVLMLQSYYLKIYAADVDFVWEKSNAS